MVYIGLCTRYRLKPRIRQCFYQQELTPRKLQTHIARRYLRWHLKNNKTGISTLVLYSRKSAEGKGREIRVKCTDKELLEEIVRRLMVLGKPIVATLEEDELAALAMHS